MASNQQDTTSKPDVTVPDSRLFRMKDHCNDSFLVMNQLRKENQLCDITFRINSETFSAHRVVVASASPYLRAMFTCGMKESSQDEIELRDIEPQAMAALIEYFYTGEVMVNVENVQDLLPAAGILQLKELKQACCAFLSDHMDVTNCLGIKQFADLHSCPILLKKANRFIIRKFVEIVKNEEFLQLPHTVLKELLENDHLHVESEMQVFSAFMTWVNHDLEKRAPNAFELLDVIRVQLLPKEFWTDMFQQESLFQQSQACRAFLKGYLMGMNMDSEDRKPRSPIETIYTIGGRNSQRCLASAERYIPEDDRWEELPNMKQVRTAVAAGSLDGKLYAIGGECETKFAHEGTLYLSTVEYYDPIHNNWNSVADMKHPRSFTAVAVMEGVYVCVYTYVCMMYVCVNMKLNTPIITLYTGKLYAIGGETTAHCYKSVEAFDPKTNTWTSLPDMNIARSGAGASCMEGKLYVVGGQDRSLHHSSVECYNVEDNCWRRCASMRYARSGVAAVVFSRQLYAIGGRDRHRQAYYDVVERYSPDTNTWDTFHRLTHPRAWPSACVYKTQLYVTGGYDGQNRLRTVEKFDCEDKKWKRVADMNEFRAGCGSAVL